MGGREGAAAAAAVFIFSVGDKREGANVAAAMHSAGLMTSVDDGSKTSAPPAAVAVGGREGAAAAAAVLIFSLA